ncbi:hypothetical protein P171DRAFT_274444 [Karstenula rhodostoma CBS 690.94]|uniref:Uncharacterized protein n=1 Tax=Karstenula rhodostoma CBS 690.94 TaxID=1392251 RepID=A0A9P4PKR3_9PLEO|nr:hypothetical protein P171DRAFT_274444 [Karstenula rhodostoma CBS 690.94]
MSDTVLADFNPADEEDWNNPPGSNLIPAPHQIRLARFLGPLPSSHVPCSRPARPPPAPHPTPPTTSDPSRPQPASLAPRPGTDVRRQLSPLPVPYK